MEIKGIKVDKKSLQKLSKEFESEILNCKIRYIVYVEKNLILILLNSWEAFFLKP